LDTAEAFETALRFCSVGRFDEAAPLFRVVKSGAQTSGDTLAAARAYLGLIALYRAKSDKKAAAAEFRALERAALMFPASPLETAIQRATTNPLLNRK
jgi:hypothetical protein